MSSFEHDHLIFNFEEYGSGVPLIFSHGLGASLNMVRDVMGPLEGVRVILYDNRAHGRTSGAVDPGKLTFACMADDMAAVLDSLRIESAVIGGESMGAGIALAFSRRHPQRVRGLILSRPAWLNTPYPPPLDLVRPIARLINEFGLAQASARYAESDDFRQLNASFPETAKSVLRNLQDATNANLGLIYEVIPASVPFEDFAELSAIDAPTLLFASHRDPIHPFDYATRIAAAIPGSTLQELPSKNENLEEHQRILRRRMTEFISSLAAR